ncbi:MAG TPA: hypothetical protein PKA88_09705 [Polyangiaceae bacterium]|nr:hypothetical protein [Polyangiaceae bacterium]
MRTALFVLLAFSSSGCTVLGPMPIVTGSTGGIERRMGAEVQVAATPGFYLSKSTSEDPEGAPARQLAGWLDVGELVSAEGLALGGRYVGGGDGGGYGEPMVRYRHGLDQDDRFTLHAAGFGTLASGTHRGASYDATRVGAELAINGRISPESNWLELHGFIGAAVLGLNATGTYCVAQGTGIGVDCNEDGTDSVVSGEVSGAFPGIFAGAGLDLARHLDIPFHGARLEGMVAAGTMPEIRNGERTDTKTWTTIGLALTVRAGASQSNKK